MPSYLSRSSSYAPARLGANQCWRLLTAGRRDSDRFVRSSGADRRVQRLKLTVITAAATRRHWHKPVQGR